MKTSRRPVFGLPSIGHTLAACGALVGFLTLASGCLYDYEQHRQDCLDAGHYWHPSASGSTCIDPSELEFP